MNIQKRKLADLEMGYAISSLQLSGKTHIVVATEGKGPCLLFSPPDWRMRTLADGPGGSMSMLGIPGRNETLLAVMECYPIYRFEHGGVYLYTPPPEDAAGGEHPAPQEQRAQTEQNRKNDRSVSAEAHRPLWRGRRVFDMPFIHRMEMLSIGGRPYVVAATIAESKTTRDDWSKSGSVYLVPVPDDLDGAWTPAAIIHGITKNHGLHRTVLDGKEVLLVSGAEGLFSVPIPASAGGPWETEKLITREISEVFAADLDDDGNNELVTIEPFHGNRLCVYKRSGGPIDGIWHRLFEADLDFGHGVWAGTLAGEPAIMAGSRSGDKDLSAFTIQSLVPFVAQRSVLEHGAGPTQVLVLHEEGRDLIFSVNQAMEEIALYTVTP